MHQLYPSGHQPPLDPLPQLWGYKDIPGLVIGLIIYMVAKSILGRYKVVELATVLYNTDSLTLEFLSLGILLCWHIGKSAVRSLEKGALAFAMMNIIDLCVSIWFIFRGFQVLREPGMHHTDSSSSLLVELFVCSVGRMSVFSTMVSTRYI
jgi:hypothetical protein